MVNQGKAIQLQPLSGADLVAIRKSQAMNQAKFWGRLGVTQSGGSRYESGRNLPKPVRLLVEIAYGKRGQVVVDQLRRVELRS